MYTFYDTYSTKKRIVLKCGMRLVLKTCIQTTVVGMSRQVDDNDQIIIPTKCHRRLTSNTETQDLCSIYLSFLITMCDIHEIIFRSEDWFVGSGNILLV